MTLLPDSCSQPIWLSGIDTGEPRRYVAVKNGLLDLDALMEDRQPVLLPHSPLWFSPIRFDFDYDHSNDEVNP